MSQATGGSYPKSPLQTLDGAPLAPAPQEKVEPSREAALAEELGRRFWRHGADCSGLEAIACLCRLALVEKGDGPALRTLYRRIVEPLCDDFTLSGVEQCNRVLLRVIDCVAAAPEGRSMAALLERLGLRQTEALFARYQRISRPAALDAARCGSIRKVLLLSRVTAGADIAITSIMVQRLRQAMPEAEVVLVGPAHLPEIFAGLPGVVARLWHYSRQGTLVDKVASWPGLYALVQEEFAGLDSRRALLVDPDSRLSQLGLLPLAGEEASAYFNSRLPPAAGTNCSLAELTNGWLDRLLGSGKFCAPAVSLPAGYRQEAAVFCQRLRANGCRTLVAINFGVADDERKRLADPFEEQLLLALLQLPETIIVLDSGCSCEEKKRVENLLARMAAAGVATDWLGAADLAGKEVSFAGGVVGFQGSLGAIGAVIEQADVFVGYDSCCQHLAGAVATPFVVLFAGAPNHRFLARWQPPDRTGKSRVIPVDHRMTAPGEHYAGLLAEARAAVAAIAGRAGSLPSDD